MLGYDYPLMGVIWTLVLFFIWVVWLILLFRVFSDIFRSHDLSGWGKAAWLLLVLVLPFLGIVIYLIARGSAMAERDVINLKARNQASTTTGSAEELAELADLKDSGAINDAEFAARKAKILA